ncbi:aldehyde dehydrogenase [Atractiella rhizophila]|nr:aldehyde dehydrogenase [Atractiella rhizophila]
MGEYQLPYTPVSDIGSMVDEIRKTFRTGNTKNLEFRLEQLRCLGFMIEENQEAIVDALSKDLGRSRMESFLAEIWPLKEDIAGILKNLPRWIQPTKANTELIWKFANPMSYHEPKGAVLIIGAWNYPFSLLLSPLFGAIAAGCTAIVKPSELAKHSAALLAELLPKYVDPSCYKLVNGGIEETTVLVDRPWDHIFFTGSTAVGRIMSKAAGKHMSPITLELGGKSPVCIFEDCDVDLTAKRLLFGKHMNTGQTCIAPDYILCPSSVQPRLIEAMKKGLKEMYPSTDGDELKSGEYPKIINERNYSRLTKLLQNTSGNVEIGGNTGDGLRIGFTVVTGVKTEDSLMSEEIFGPLFPILNVESKDEMVAHINSGDDPLALYVFTSDKQNVKYIQNRTKSGQLVHNDCMVQSVIPGLPFGGVGASGQGNYHGKASFTTFSYERSFLSVPKFYDYVAGGRYHPYSKSQFDFLNDWVYPSFTKDRPKHLPPKEKLVVKVLLPPLVVQAKVEMSSAVTVFLAGGYRYLVEWIAFLRPGLRFPSA